MHEHLATQPADDLSALKTGLINAQRVVLSSNSILACVDLHQWLVRTHLENIVAPALRKLSEQCTAAYRELARDAAKPVRRLAAVPRVRRQRCRVTHINPA